MSSFHRVALLQSHQQLQPLHDYYVPDLIEALTLARGRAVRAAGPARASDRLAARFHLAGHRSVVVGRADGDDGEALKIRPDDARLPGRPRELHLSVARLVSLAARLDHRRLGNDPHTLARRARGFRLAWLPGFAIDLAAVVAAIAGLAAFHLRTALRSRLRRGEGRPPRLTPAAGCTDDSPTEDRAASVRRGA